MVDGEIVVPGATGLDFDALQQRIHPADSRVRTLADEDAGLVHRVRPARPSTTTTSRSVRSASVAIACATVLGAVEPPIHVTPATSSIGRGRAIGSRGSKVPGSTASSPSRWSSTYQPDKRVMFKVKHHRTADCVVAGFRTHKDGERRRLAAPRSVRRRRHAAPRRRVRVVHGVVPPRARARRSSRCGRTRSTTIRGRTGRRCRRMKAAACPVR